MSNNQDKRSEVRIPVDQEIFVRDTVNNVEIGTLANINSDGFMIISDGGLKEDHAYQVVFEKEQGSASSDLALGAECLWVSETGTGDQVWSGFQIMECSDKARVQIDAIIAEHRQ